MSSHGPTPRYDRSGLTPGIAHIGVGGFHRAHQAAYLDELMARGEAQDWGIVGIGVLPGDAKMRDALAGQDHLYTLALKQPDMSTEVTTIGSIIDYRFAPDDQEGVLDLLTDPAIRIVSLTVTEGGYHVHAVTGELDTSDEALAADIRAEGLPTTAFGYVVEALRRRREAGTPAFTVMSCDNIPGNGDVAKKMIGAFASERDAELGEWIATEVSFPNSMVDRITPQTTDEDIAAIEEEHGIADAWPVVAEPFIQWVLEDDFPQGRPPFEEAGVQVVDDVEPYELMKLRLLNGTHQAMGFLGYLSGHRYSHEVLADDVLRAYLERLMAQAAPTVPPVPGIDLEEYQRTLVERFSSPAVKDTLARLCAETTDRIPKFVLPTIKDNLERGGDIDAATLVVAAWARYAEGVDEQGEPIEVVDPRKDERMAAAAKQDEDPLAFLRNRDLFGDLVDDERFTDVYTRQLASLHDRGAHATVEALLDGSLFDDAR